MSIEFAKSKSGHDRNQYYLIYKKDEENVYLVNGESRTIQNAKKKNRKHIQIIKNLPEQVLEILEPEINNLSVKRAIKTYQKIICNSKPEIDSEK